MTEEEFDRLVEEVKRLSNEDLLKTVEFTAEHIRRLVGFMDLVEAEIGRRQYLAE